MKRVPLLEPWPGPWARWAGKYCTNNLWRIAATVGDFNDAMSECALQYVECRKRYGAVVDDPRWFMALYQMCVTSRFNDLSVKDSRYREVIDLTAMDENMFDDAIIIQPVVSKRSNEKRKAMSHAKPVKACAAYSTQDVMIVLTERTKRASKELQQVLNIMFNAPTEMMQTISADCKSSKNFFHKLVGQLGIPKQDSMKVEQELRTLLLS